MIDLRQAARNSVDRARNLLARGVVKLVYNSLKTQGLSLTLLADENRDAIEHPQEYGFTSYPKVGAEAIVAFFGGNRSHGVAVSVFDKRYRPQDLVEGESCLYDDLGTRVNLRRGNILEIIAATKVRIVSPLTEITGNVTVAGTFAVQGNISTQANIMASGNVGAGGDITDTSGSNGVTIKGLRTAYNLHKHSETGTTTNTTDHPV